MIEYYQKIIHEERRGIIPGFLRFFLAVTAFFYGIAVRIRNYLFDIRFKKSYRVNCYVVSVGNVTLGGTGKTPFVAWLAEYFLQTNQIPGFISRGYKASNSGKYRQNDEAKELALRLPNVPHFQGADRFQTASKLLQTCPETNVLILDDAFQHRRIVRDLNIVLLDALDPFGLNHLFPRGYLREPLCGLRRADVILLSRANLISIEMRNSIREQVQQYNRTASWGEIAHQFGRVLGPQHEFQIFSEWYDKVKNKARFIAFCGLGNPEGFRKSLVQEGIEPLCFIAFPDHHRYTEQDKVRLLQKKEELGATGFLTTMKDRVKLSNDNLNGFPLYTLETNIVFLSGETELIQAILDHK